MFVVTGNTFNTGGNWMGGEAIIRLQAGPIFTGQPTDYWAPTNWLSLDNTDTDLGGVSATLIDVPGATPSQLVLALGKDRNAYLINRNSLGGITAPVAQANMISGATNRGTSAVTYHTSQGTYFAFHGFQCRRSDQGRHAGDRQDSTEPSCRTAIAAGYPRSCACRSRRIATREKLRIWFCLNTLCVAKSRNKLRTDSLFRQSVSDNAVRKS